MRPPFDPDSLSTLEVRLIGNQPLNMSILEDVRRNANQTFAAEAPDWTAGGSKGFELGALLLILDSASFLV